jgi:histidine triad (HIT) family protein
MKEDCIFCKIANGVIPTDFVYQNEYVVAFKDINPKASTHILVIPKEHYASLNELDNDKILLELFKGVKETAKKLNLESYRTVINTGKGAGQEVFHIHAHILSGKVLPKF